MLFQFTINSSCHVKRGMPFFRSKCKSNDISRYESIRKTIIYLLVPTETIEECEAENNKFLFGKINGRIDVDLPVSVVEIHFCMVIFEAIFMDLARP